MGVQTRHIINVLAIFSGGYNKIKFQNKDVCNYVQLGKSLDLPNDDIQGVLCYVTTKKATDPGFYCQNTIENASCMRDLF